MSLLSQEPLESASVCRSCGACCGYFRILLNWTELGDFSPEGVPAEMTVKISDYVRVMAGTETSPGRCAALEGEIGKRVFCRIYEKRCSQCIEFNPITADGEKNEACENARNHFGLKPLEIWRK